MLCGSAPMNDMIPPVAMSRRVKIMKKVHPAATDVAYADFLDFLGLQTDVRTHLRRM